MSSDFSNIFSSISYNAFSFIPAVLLIVGCYKMFEKAGQAGWKAIIPFYREYILFTKIAKLKVGLFIGYIVSYLSIIAFLITLFLSIAFALSPGGNGGSIVFFIISILIILAGVIASTVIKIYAFYKAFQKFGKTGGIAFLLAYFNYIGVLIVGFDSSVYMDNGQNINQVQTLKPMFCPNCGQKIDGKFCSNCGTKVD